MQTILIVGKIEWGADDLANETLTLYAPDTSLNLAQQFWRQRPFPRSTSPPSTRWLSS